MEVIFIRNKIYEIRGQRVMLDFDLAALYEVPTKALNQAVKRNAERFPEDFMFRLTEEEWMRSQFVTSSAKSAINIQTPGNQEGVNKQNGIQIISNPPTSPMWSQFVTTSPQKRRKGSLPYAFTEHGVTMLASVLRSDNAVKMSIEVVRAFIALKQFALQQNNMDTKLQQIEDRIGEHDVQLNHIYDAIENLLDEKASQRHWEDRERIGFKKRK
ncbi:MAG TPA: ORF6N domain-containing protein [Puia sp.]